MASVQQSYQINPELGFPGSLARPTEPHSTESGLISVPTGGKSPSPGDSLYYDEATNRFAVVSTAAHQVSACAILGYRVDQVAEESAKIEYEDGEEIQFYRFGTVWVVAKAATEYGQLIQMDIATPYRWEVYSRVTTLANVKQYPIVCVSRNPVAAAGFMQAQIGFGRVI